METPSKVLTVELLLGKENISGVCNTTSKGGVGHDDNDSVLLHIERVWVQGPLVAKGVESLGWHDEIPSATNGVGNQLDDIGCDRDRGITEREEHVDGASNGGQDHSDDPGTNGVARHILFIIRFDHGRMESQD